MLSIDDLFKGLHFDQEIIILCVRWYLRFKLNLRDLVETMMTVDEHGALLKGGETRDARQGTELARKTPKG